MGNTCSMLEHGSWDAHPDVKDEYEFPSEPLHDMTQPLSHYFISSGHNSYLTSDQLVGKAGTSTIISSLKAGCRVVELDCYSSDRGPVCKHGGTATSPVLFEECIKAIRKHAFEASPYPVIVTMENHADAEGQLLMVKILRKELGEHLFIPEPNDTKEWRSPEALRERILLRTNVAKAVPELKQIVYIANSGFRGYTTMNQLGHITSSSMVESAVEKLGKKLDITREAGYKLRKENNNQDFSSAPDGLQPSPSTRRGKANKVPVNKTKTQEEEEEEAAATASMFTIEDAYNYSRRHLLRVYPAGWRVTSGNYDPTLAWNLGATFVALNWQEWDKALWINQAKFRVNNNLGYALKPSWMLQGRMPDSPQRLLKVHVYSAFKNQGANCFCGKDDLIVSLEVRGWYEDTDKQKTKHVQDSGKLKVEQTYTFPVRCPELSVLLVVMQDHDYNHNDTIGYFSLPLETMRPGDYRLPMTAASTGHKMPLLAAWIKVRLEWDDIQQHDAGAPQGLAQAQAAPQGFNQGVPQAAAQNFNQGMPQAAPLGINQGVPQAAPQGFTQGVPQAAPQGFHQGAPQVLPQAALNGAQENPLRAY